MTESRRLKLSYFLTVILRIWKLVFISNGRVLVY